MRLLQNREPQAPKSYILPARAAVVLAGLLLGVNGVLLLSAGYVGGSLSLVVVGNLLILLALLLMWSGLRPVRDDLYNPPVVFAAELFFRIIG